MEVITTGSGEKFLRKWCMSPNENAKEIEVMQSLSKELDGIPEVIQVNSNDENSYIDMKYTQGIRMFNLFSELDCLAKEKLELSSQIIDLKDVLVNKCLDRQKLIQNGLLTWRDKQGTREFYPYNKVSDMMHLINRLLDLDIDTDSFESEINAMYMRFTNKADVPFRDATPKNMVLDCQELNLSRFAKDGDNNIFDAVFRRRDFLASMIEQGNTEDILNAQIVDYDFSSCEHDTTKYDDPISFLGHSTISKGIPDSKDLTWQKGEVVNDDIAITYIIRFLRYGGRKLSYNILHPNATILRYFYKGDSDKFYFANMQKSVEHFMPGCQEQFPQIMSFLTRLNQSLELGSTVVKNAQDDPFKNRYPDRQEDYYTDIFPN